MRVVPAKRGPQLTTSLDTELVVNLTIANNTAGSLGGGMWDELAKDNVKYTILSANTPTNCATGRIATIVSRGQNVENGSSCGFVAPADKPSTDPLLLPLAHNPGPNAFVPPTDALPANSPAVDFSPAGTCPSPATDERGVTRPQGTACDSGAYELMQARTPAAALRQGRRRRRHPPPLSRQRRRLIT